MSPPTRGVLRHERDILSALLQSHGTEKALLTAIIETGDVGKMCAMLVRELPQRLSSTEHAIAVAVARSELMCELLRLIVGDHEVNETKRGILLVLDGRRRRGDGWT